jgi:hypothetical protein
MGKVKLLKGMVGQDSIHLPNPSKKGAMGSALGVDYRSSLHGFE